MLNPEFLRAKFHVAMEYGPYVGTGNADQRANWERVHAAVRLTDQQVALIQGFTRAMHILVVSGTWCGDCVQQCPILDHVARTHPGRIRLRLLDRDANLDLAEQVRICGGLRVPTALFLDEDWEFVSLLGDRTLSRYRAIASRTLGASCPLPGWVPGGDELAASVADWLGEIERVQLILRLSPRLREKHGD